MSAYFYAAATGTPPPYPSRFDLPNNDHTAKLIAYAEKVTAHLRRQGRDDK